MYALEMLLVSWGILAFRRALESPTLGRLAPFAVIVALLLYTQYWTLYLLLVVGVLLVALAWRSSYRHAARRMLHRDGGRRVGVRSVAADVPLPARAHGHAVGDRATSRHPDRVPHSATSRAGTSKRVGSS